MRPREITLSKERNRVICAASSYFRVPVSFAHDFTWLGVFGRALPSSYSGRSQVGDDDSRGDPVADPSRLF